ncbi:MAG: hypothetical protein OEZ06_04430 [Myxococcales bacterium]|nr:hypothetical protein [Myxococcales bacterium]
MAAELLFSMSNPHSTCTAASLTWCHMMLSGVTTPKAEHFLPQNETLQRHMHTVGIGSLDFDPSTQVALMQFEIVAQQSAGAITSHEIAAAFKANAPYLGIFWNSFHTMAYRYNHVDKRYFDNNYGLWKAKTTKDIVAQMEKIRADHYGSESWKGYVVLKFGKRLRLV